MPPLLDPHRWAAPDAIALSSAALRRGIRFVGRYPDWASAAAHASGYDQDAILQRTVAATEDVRSGRAAFDRDGVAFAEPYYPYPLIAGLLDAALRADGILSVIDFGGALGSTYFQCRPWLAGLKSIRWSVVEQAHYVDAGVERFESAELKFERSIAACQPAVPTAAVLSSVLQYLPDPGTILRELAIGKIGSILISRTPVIDGDNSIISVQHVPAKIVASSYPTRLFARAELLQPLGDYRILSEHEDGQDRPIFSLGQWIRYRGFTAIRE